MDESVRLEDTWPGIDEEPPTQRTPRPAIPLALPPPVDSLAEAMMLAEVTITMGANDADRLDAIKAELARMLELCQRKIVDLELGHEKAARLLRKARRGRLTADTAIGGPLRLSCGALVREGAQSETGNIARAEWSR